MKVVIMKGNGEVDKIATFKANIKGCLETSAKWIKSGASSAWGFVKENKDDLIVLVPVGVAAVTGLRKATQKNTVDTERYRIDHTFYDPRTGRHWELRRKMNNRERMELEERQAAGEMTGRILDDMGILK